MKIGFFGGSFNPPHVSHVLAVAYVLATEDIDEIWVVPCYRHPFAKELAPFEDRFAMCELAMGWLPKVRVSRVEQELGGESRTLRTVEHVLSLRPNDSLRLIVGGDVLVDGPKWQGFEKITSLAPPIVLGRKGVVSPHAPPPVLPSVSSSDIRLALAEGRGVEIERLLPRGVLPYIEQRGMYRTSGSGPHSLPASTFGDKP